jgi:hypothetical protein
MNEKQSGSEAQQTAQEKPPQVVQGQTAQQQAQSAPQDQQQTAEQRSDRDRNGNRGKRLKPNRKLEARIVHLDRVLHGPPEGEDASPEVNWNGKDETQATFESIVQELESLHPEPRPASDLPDWYVAKPKGD